MTRRLSAFFFVAALAACGSSAKPTPDAKAAPPLVTIAFDAGVAAPATRAASAPASAPATQPSTAPATAPSTQPSTQPSTAPSTQSATQPSTAPASAVPPGEPPIAPPRNGPPEGEIIIEEPTAVGDVDVQPILDALAKVKPQLEGCRPHTGKIEHVKVQFHVALQKLQLAAPAADNKGDPGTARCIANRVKTAAPSWPDGVSGIIIVEATVPPPPAK